MNSRQIEQYLGFLGQKLADMQTEATLILLGGALMITQIGNRKTTQDIDVVIATGDRQTYQAVQQAISLVAQEKKLPASWLNDDVTLIVDQVGRPKSSHYWKSFAAVDVYIPELEYIFALKCLRDETRMIVISKLSHNDFTCRQKHKLGQSYIHIFHQLY